MRYLYESHVGGLFVTDSPDDDRYCEQCGDYDWLLGSFSTPSEFWDLIEYNCSMYGSGGYSLQYIYPIMVEEFGLPSVEYEDDYHRDCGFCLSSDEEIIAVIEFLIGRKVEYESQTDY